MPQTRTPIADDDRMTMLAQVGDDLAELHAISGTVAEEVSVIKEAATAAKAVLRRKIRIAQTALARGYTLSGEGEEPLTGRGAEGGGRA